MNDYLPATEIEIVLDSFAYLPTKAHEADAGFDLRTPTDVMVPARASIVVDTGVHFGIPFGYVGYIKSKSGLNVKHGITAEGVIDSGYTGSVVVKLYNNSYEDYFFNTGDKITQIVFEKIPYITLKQVDTLADTERGTSGFGSSGK